ncbi:hypothetical protein Pyn_23901 [Prunus yedoensis var. nudiflora]|uniref:ABC transporter domain-containing protein n=1 Tax=Prunus yedoensis var. nudiflora TaxID=2094558 RepID=A0A314YJ28_PRUYE|nr:hypothetical protein Pyn_23901 [Prunus yedoensis var. nudiflora]
MMTSVSTSPISIRPLPISIRSSWQNSPAYQFSSVLLALELYRHFTPIAWDQLPQFTSKKNYRESEIRRAASLANAYEFISGMKDGYQTYCGERGVQLSGGQKHRIALARAILKNPRILLLDEATSALDSVLETLVQEALDKMMVGRTCVVVAHRLSTIQKADSISVIENGKVVEQGSHNELLAIGRGGAYHSLFQLQNSHSA